MIKNFRGSVLAVALGLSGCDAAATKAPEGLQGIVEYEERTLAFEVPGRIAALRVDEGVEIHVGDEIGRLDDTLEHVARRVQEANAAAMRARVQLLQAGSRQEDIRALKASVAAAKSTEKLATRTLEREEGLAVKGIGRPADLDSATTAMSQAQAHRQELEQQLQRARRGARPEEIDVAVADAEAAEAALKAYDERLARHVLRAAHAGYVLEVHREEGEFVPVGAPVITMADLARPYVDVFVPQGRIEEATLGGEAQVRIDATDEAFAGTVEWIGRTTEFTPKFLFSERERPNLVLRVRVRVHDPEHRLRAGVPAFVMFGTESEA